MLVLLCCYLANVTLSQFGDPLGSETMVLLALLCLKLLVQASWTLQLSGTAFV